MENANPTVIAVEDLPTRRDARALATKAPGNCLLDIDATKAYTSFQHSYDLPDPESEFSDSSSDDVEPIDEQEIYDLISTISDPEHPISLGSLSVVNLPDIYITPAPAVIMPTDIVRVLVEITPTISHCSLATAIGLGVRIRLEQSLPPRFRVDVRVKEGTHSQDDQVNKQLADKERVAAAMENKTLMRVVEKMLETCAKPTPKY